MNLAVNYDLVMANWPAAYSDRQVVSCHGGSLVLGSSQSSGFVFR